MTINIKVGTVLADSFTVRKIRKEPIGSEMSNPIIESIVVELESIYENAAFLGFYTFLNSPPPFERWTPIVAKDLEYARIFPMWKPSQIKQQCICLPYKVRTSSGSILAVTQMLAAKNNTVVSAKIWWSGFPGINKFYVGFKPGMKARTEELLLSGFFLTP
jgi:hypothetical protein